MKNKMKGKIFTAPEVQSILSGNKTMFREICKRQPQGEMEQPYVIRQAGITEFNYPFGKIPYKVGQKIFVKESFNIFAGQVAYKQSLANAEKYIWKPASQMKQEDSRLTLLIKEIRVEKLSEISKDDAIAEAPQYSIIQPFGNKCPIDFFKTLWNAIHKKPEAKFEANPWVWSIRFEVVNE
jgi:hypothetical protein